MEMDERQNKHPALSISTTSKCNWLTVKNYFAAYPLSWLIKQLKLKEHSSCGLTDALLRFFRAPDNDPLPSATFLEPPKISHGEKLQIYYVGNPMQVTKWLPILCRPYNFLLIGSPPAPKPIFKQESLPIIKSVLHNPEPIRSKIT